MLHKLLTKKIFICSFSVLAVLFIGVLALLTALNIFLSDFKLINKCVHKATGLTLQVENYSFNYSPFALNFRADELFLLSEKNETPILTLKKSYLKINIFPFLLRKLSIDTFLANEADLLITRQKDGTFDFFKYFNGKKSFIKPDLASSKINILDYNILINDYATKNKFLIDGKYISANGLDFNKKLAVSTKGDFVVNENNKTSYSPYLIDIDLLKSRKKLNLKKHDILLSSLNISFLKSYFSDLKFNNFDAKIDIYSNSTDEGIFKLYIFADKLNIAFDYKGDKNTIVANKPVLNEIDFNFMNSDFIINKGELWTDGGKVEYSGKIKNINNIKNIEPNLNIGLRNIDLHKFVQILPDTLIPMKEPYVKNLKKYNANALADGDIKVRFKSKEDFNVKGKINFNDVYVVERPKNAKTSFGSCEFIGQEVLIDVYANAPNDAVLTVTGKSKMELNPKGEFYIKSHGKLDLAFAHGVLMPVKEILALRMGPLPYMTLKGAGEIELKTKGSKEKANLYGYFVTDDATVTLKDLNAVLTEGKVKVLFDKSDISFNGAKGKIDGANVSIDGKADTLGNLNVLVDVKDISAKKAMNIAQTSPIVTSALDGGEFLKSFKPDSGNIDFNMNLYGNIPPDAVFGQSSDSVFAKGKITFKGNSLTIEPDIKTTNVKGELNFENSADFNLSADIYDSPFKITGKVEQKGSKNKIVHGIPSMVDLKFFSDNINSSSVGDFITDNISLFAPQNRIFAKNLAQIFNSSKFALKADVEARGLVYPNSAELDLSKFDFSGYIKGINLPNSDFNIKQGDISLKGKSVKFNGLRISASNVDILLNGYIDKFASQKPFNNLKVTLYNSSLKSYVDLFAKLLPSNQRKNVNAFKDFQGSVSGNIKLFADKIDGEINPSKISFTDSKTGNKVNLIDGKIKLKNEKTYLKSFNLTYGGIPLYIDGFIQSDGDINPELNLYMAANLSEETCDRVINPLLKYPVLLTGDMSLKGRIQGRLNSYTTYLTAVINEGSDINYMGVRLGDTASKREISSKIKFTGNYADINYIRYFRYILHNKKHVPYDLIKISGGIRLNKNDVEFKNLKFYTPNPAPARFINLLFKRSIAKEGEFVSNLVLNGSLSNIKANGNLVFSKVFLPIYDSVVENINIVLNKNTGRATFKLVIFDTPVDFLVNFENKVTFPFVIDSLNIHSSEISVDNLIKAFDSFSETATKISNTPHAAQTQNITLSPSDVQIKKGAILVDKIILNGVEANSLKLNFSHSPKDSSLIINDSYIAIAGGLIKGKGKYNFLTDDIKVSSTFLNCDADLLTKAFFNMTGQVYGNTSGNFTMEMKDFDYVNYIDKIKAVADFEIQDGRMPKLGSIEYLLRASNFIKSGIFGLTLNNVIELLKPYRQGNFNKISGNLKIDSGMVKDLKIYSQGDELSTYTSGTYDIATGVGDIEILGKLSRKISNLLGPIGNASVVSVLNMVTKNKADELFKTQLLQNINKIPLMNLSNDDFRIFSVKMNGAISATDAVKSFTWLN